MLGRGRSVKPRRACVPYVSRVLSLAVVGSALLALDARRDVRARVGAAKNPQDRTKVMNSKALAIVVRDAGISSEKTRRNHRKSVIVEAESNASFE
jgi:hypothetical protein